MKMKKSFFIISFLTILMLLFSTSAIANESQVIELQPSSDNYVNLKGVYLIKYGEDKVKFRIQGHKETGTSPLYFSIEIDPVNKTYKTIEKDLTTKKLSQKDSVLNSQTKTLSTESSQYSAAIAIETIDPVDIVCCESGLALNWWVSYDLITDSSRDKWSWDGQPTNGNTYWYLSYHNYGDWIETGSYAMVESNAEHYNYDFGDDNLVTNAYHYLTLYGYNDGSFDYIADWDHTGEFAYLLHGNVWIM